MKIAQKVGNAMILANEVSGVADASGNVIIGNYPTQVATVVKNLPTHKTEGTTPVLANGAIGTYD